MDIEALREYCICKKGVIEEFPFDEVTLVFKVLGKMFAVISLCRLPQAVNLKCDPEKALLLREQYDGLVTPAWHMNKTHWNSCLLNKLPTNMLIELIDDSYELVVSKFTKNLKATLASL